MKFTMNRARTVTSRMGHSIHFEKGVATHVPPVLYEEVLAAGGVADEELPEPEETPEPTADEREKLLMAALEDIATKNNRDDFSAVGAPHTKALATRLGFAISAAERDAAWLRFQGAKGD